MGFTFNLLSDRVKLTRICFEILKKLKRKLNPFRKDICFVYKQHLKNELVFVNDKKNQWKTKLSTNVKYSSIKKVNGEFCKTFEAFICLHLLEEIIFWVSGFIYKNILGLFLEIPHLDGNFK